MSRALIEALHVVAERLERGAPYQWGHMGQCNCGHLAQVVSRRTAADIHRSAIARNTGEWSEHANDRCPSTGALIDDVFDDLLAIGLTRQDIVHLEHLDDPRVVARVGRALRKNQRADAVDYVRAWAGLLSEELQPVLVAAAPVDALADVLPDVLADVAPAGTWKETRRAA